MIGRFRLLALCTIFSAIFCLSWEVKGAAFSGGIVVERIGGDADFMGGAAQVVGTATPVFLDEFSQSTNTRLQTIALPSTDPDGSGAQRAITENGASNNIGFVGRSVDGRYLTTGGYGVDAGTTGLVGNATTNNRIIARIAADGTVDTSTGYTDATSQNVNLGATLRSTASLDGTSFYFGTANTTEGTRYLGSFGSVVDTTVRVGGFPSQARTVGIFGGRLFYTNSATGTPALTSLKDTNTNGIPTSDAAITKTEVVPIASNGNPEQFFFLDRDPNLNYDGTGLDTLYLAHLGAISGTTNPTGVTNTGGLQRYTFDGANWNQDITFNSGLSSTSTDSLFGGLNGLAFAGLDASNNPIIYATTAASAAVGNALVKLVDAGPSSAFSLVATAPVTTVFRGVALAPLSAGVPGDYNANGIVDAADYVLWRKDPSAHGGDPAGYNAWRAHFGNTSGSGLGTAAVPEPAAFALCVAALAISSTALRRRFALQIEYGAPYLNLKLFQRTC
jgi:hypothetical protein